MANLSIGIVGLPNVGKSTLFRALTSVAVPAENYPFCTIDPNVGVVEVPDPRLERLAELVDPPEVTAAAVEFVDIAGLVEGASGGEGLGNEFLEHVREVDAVAHVLRCFEDEGVARAGGGGDPLTDRRIVAAELARADLAVVERNLERARKRAEAGERGAGEELSALREAHGRLEEGRPARTADLAEEERRRLKGYNLLTLKPVMYVLNVDEEAAAGGAPRLDELEERLVEEDPGAAVVRISAQLEAEAAEFPEEDRRELLEAHGLERTGLDRLVREGYRLLGLQTFFTWNENELRAWPVPKGASAPEAAGRVHSDFREGFIRADTIAYETFEEIGSMKEARELGKVRSEGRDYEVRDGDIMLFRTDA